MKAIPLLSAIVSLIMSSAPAPAFAFSAAKQDLVYKTVGGHEIGATLFLPGEGSAFPVFAYFHGGGFVYGNRDEGLKGALKDKLLAAGFAVLSFDYRLAPETKLEEIVEDARDAMRWLKSDGGERFGLDVSRIVVAGGSAGGYLALATCFREDSRAKAVISISAPTGFSVGNIQMGDRAVLGRPGPYDLVKSAPVSHGDYAGRKDLWKFLGKNRLLLHEIFGFDPAREPERLAPFSLEANMNADCPATLLVHARNDRLVDVRQAEALFGSLREKGVRAELFLVDEGHSSELIERNPAAADAIVSFLSRSLND
jgi:acetyl esterase/lipase